jgi:hypothetical protein
MPLRIAYARAPLCASLVHELASVELLEAYPVKARTNATTRPWSTLRATSVSGSEGRDTSHAVTCSSCVSLAVVYENDAPYCGPCWTKRNAWVWNLR